MIGTHVVVRLDYGVTCRYCGIMSTSEVTVVEPDQTLTGKRGLDIAKVEEIMSREQLRDLSYLYRVDQIKIFDETAREFHRKAKPSDTGSLQLFFEIRDQYVAAKADPECSQKDLQGYLKMMDEILSRAETRRDKALDRLQGWKKHAEDRGAGMGDMTTEELEAIQRG
jgi:hypothetical protein